MSLKDRLGKLFSKKKKTVKKIILFKDHLRQEAELLAVGNEILNRYGAISIEVLPLVNGVICKVPAESLNDLALEKQISCIEDNHTVKLVPVFNKGIYGNYENYYEELIPWGTARIGADKCWVASRGKAVKVAVLDSGISAHHPDLKDNVMGGVSLVSQGATYYKGNSYHDDNGHGSHIAGTIAAIENGTGIIGIAPETHLYSVKVLNFQGKGTVESLVKGLAWCVENKMQIVNMSVGTDTPSDALHAAVKEAYRAGILMIAAAGNDGSDNSVDYPGAYPEVIAVGAVDDKDKLASFNSKGREVQVLAPGTAILSTGLMGGLQKMSGTSMAAAHVTGVASLVLQKRPKMDPLALGRHLIATAEKIDGIEGPGLVRADRALRIRDEDED